MVKAVKEEKKKNEGFSKELEEMFMAGAHFGYSRQSRHPKIKSYLFGLRNNVEIFDLEKTRLCLEKAEKFLEGLAKEGKKILLVATKPGMRQLIEGAGRELSMPYVCERWLGGILTNFKIIKGRIDYFMSLRQKKTTGELNKYTKKEISRFVKELSRLERFLAGLESLTALPSALVVIDPKKEKTAFREAKQMSIPVIAILNSDSDPTGIAYPIPANDASPASVKYLLNQLVEAYKKGLVSPKENEKSL
jgi:small subunit ribosomal protein S2